MKLSLNWINEYLEKPVSINSKQLSELVSLRIAEVDKVYEPHPVLGQAVCVEIKEIKKHPGADKLNIVKVSDGASELEVVCGAGNVKVGLKVPLVREGTVLPSGMVIKKAKIRGVESSGMLCSGSELGLSETDGLLILDSMRIGQKLSDSNRFKDIILEIDNKSLTHRPDLWGHYGFAREFAIIFETKLKPLELTEFSKEKKFPLAINIQSESCYAYTGVHIINVNPGLPTPEKMKNFLETLGQRSISLSVDITNFVLLELGQPLHAFDRKTWKGSNVFIRNAKEGESCVTLDGVARKLHKEDLVIADDHSPTAIAGIMGGAHHSVTETTSELILESANFKAETIRKTSLKHNLRTDSSARFEKTLHPELTELGARRFAYLLSEVDKNVKVSSFASEYKKQSKELSLTLSLDYLEKSLGEKLEIKKINHILSGLEFRPEINNKEIKLTIPGFRSFKDIQGAHDIVEEVGRHIGFDNITPKAPILAIGIPDKILTRTASYDFKNKLSGMGYSEVYTYPMVSKSDCDRFKVAIPKNEIANPMGFEYMRDSMIVSMLNAAETNGKHGTDFDFFEIGRVYGDKEQEILALVTTKPPLEFFADLQSFNKKLRLKRSQNYPHFHPFIQFDCELEGNIGFGGRILPSLASILRIPENTYFGFLNFDEIMDKEKIKFKAPSKFPPVFFEVAIVTSRRKDSEEPRRIIEESFDVIKDVHVVDEYYFEGQDKKSLAFKVTFQKDDGTFEGTEVTNMQNSIIARLASTGFSLRT